MKINTYMIAAIVIHLVLLLIFFFGNEIDGLAYIVLIGFLLNLIGVVLIVTDKPKSGAITFIVGSLFYIPIGLIGIWGGKLVLDEV